MVEHCGGMKTAGTSSTVGAHRYRQRLDRMRRHAGTRPDARRRRHHRRSRHDLALRLRGVDTDNDSAFMNETVFDYCKANGLEQTRSRA